MRHPAQVATGGWVIPGLVFKWSPLCVFLLFDTPLGKFSGSLGSCGQCFHLKGPGLYFWSGMKVPQMVCMAVSKIKTSNQK